MKLSPHFTLAELTASNTAARLRIDNTPPDEALQHLVDLAQVLEGVRAALGAPVTITSAYRSPALNRAVGGVTSSDHTQGQAADLVAPAFGSPYLVAKKLAPMVESLGIGQLILEGIKGKQWVHVSMRAPAKAANRVITITDAGAQLGIQGADMTTRAQHKRGDTFIATSPITANVGGVGVTNFTGWIGASQLRDSTTDVLIADLEFTWLNSATGLVRLRAQNTSAWPA